MKLSKILTTLLLGVGLARCASAAPPVTCVVSGTVLDGGASPVANTIVRFRTIAPTLVSAAGIATQDLTTRTAADGTWSLTLVQGLNAQVDIPAVAIKHDTVIPTGASCPAAFTDLTLYTRGTLTPATIISTTGPSMGGDLTGSSPNPSVVGLRGVPLFADTATDGKVWIYRAANSAFRLESLPVTTAVTAIAAGQGISVTGGPAIPTVAVTNGGITGSMLATGAAAANVGSLGGDLSGTLPSPQIGTGVIVDADVNASANIAWSKISKVGATATDVGGLEAADVIATINASVETPKISAAQLAGGIAESQVTGLVADLAAKRNTADAIPQADVTGLVAALAAKEATANKGAVSGYASLDGTGKVPTAQLPATLLADGDKGDITVSGSGTAWAIDPLSVTFAKMQAIPTDTLVGRATAGTGAPESVTLTTAGRDLLDDTTAANQRTTLGLGTSAVLNVPATGDAAAGEVVKGNDTRLADSRAPTAHTHAEADVTGLTASLAAKVPTTRSVTTSAPLTGGGTLAGDLTLGISDASGAAKGIIQLAGDLSGTAASPSVASVGGTSAANVASGVALALAATDASTPSTIVKRSAGGSATLDVVGNVTGNVSGTAANVTGTVAIANGGTGQTAATAAFDALSPTSTKGDLIGHDGSASVRLAVGLDGQILTADSATATGVKWAAVAGTGTVTSVATGNGLQGGPITSSGTVDLRLNAAGGLSKILGGGNELGIAAGGVTDAMLATAVVPQARTITATAPLTIGGGASADLSANRTIAVSDATAGAKGVIQLTGDLGGTAAAPSVATVGGQTAANVAAGVFLVNAAASDNDASTLVKRDVSGNFAAGTITAEDGFAGNLTGNVTGNLAGDVNGGTVAGTIRDEGGAVFDVKAYGATGDGVTDDSAAFAAAKAAMGASGAVLYCPPGTYKIGAFDLSLVGMTLRGAGRGMTAITTTATGGTAITLSAANTGIEEIGLTVMGSASGAQLLLSMSGANTTARGVSFALYLRAISVTGDGAFVSDVIFTNPAAGALTCAYIEADDVHFERFDMGTPNPIAASNGIEFGGSRRPVVRDGVIALSGNGNALYFHSGLGIVGDATFENINAAGAGTGAGLLLGGNASAQFFASKISGGTNAIRATTTFLSARFDNCVIGSTTSGATLLHGANGTISLYNTDVLGSGTADPNVHLTDAGAMFNWYRGRMGIGNVLAPSAYGMVRGATAPTPSVEGVTIEGPTTYTTSVFSGGVLAPVTIGAASSVTITARVTHVAIADTINTIIGPPSSDFIVLIPDDPFRLGTSGNIATALTATIGVPIVLWYDDVTAKWYPSLAVAPLTSDGTAVTVAGALFAQRSVEAVTTTKSPAATESREAYTNEGDANGAAVTLPTAAAGLEYTAIVQAAQLLTINAAAGDTIRIGANVTAAAGYVRSNVVGSRVTLLAINATEWVATSIAGEWTNGTWWAYDTHAHGAIYFATPAATANTTATPIKCAGTTAAQGTPASVTQATTNRLTYTGTPTRTFKAEATISLSAAAATNARLHLYKNGSLITGSTVSRTLADTATNAVAIHARVSLAPNDYVELWCETDDGDDITIQNGVVSITSID